MKNHIFKTFELTIHLARSTIHLPGNPIAPDRATRPLPTKVSFQLHDRATCLLSDYTIVWLVGRTTTCSLMPTKINY